jgi:hypothetical protein
MSRRLSVFVLLSALLIPAGGRAAGLDYAWALPAWRATWAAPRLADNRGFAVRSTADAVYVAGVTGSHGKGAGDLFLLRYDLAGALVWQRHWGGFELDQAQGIALDGTGIWIVGAHTTDDGRVDAALLHYSYAGALLLQRTWSLGVSTLAQAVSVTADAIYVGGLVHPTRRNRDLFVSRLTRSGAPVWTRTIDGGGWDEAWDVVADGGEVTVAGYTSADATSQALLAVLDSTDGHTLRSETWGGEGNDEARAIALTPESIYVTGGAQEGRSTDVFAARFDRATLTQGWLKTTGGKVVGGGGYGISLGARGIYVAGGSYDFPAGGDAAIMRFSYAGDLEWAQVLGLPGFWDWGFDVDVRDGSFYVAGVLWQPGLAWYRVMTLAYREDFPTATLPQVLDWTAHGDPRAQEAMQHFWPGDFLRWAEGAQPASASAAALTVPRSRVDWEGASNSQRSYGHVWVDTAGDPMVGEDHARKALLGLTTDVRNGNYAFVRDYTGVKGSLLGGLIRFRYYISHDRLIPQGGYIYVGDRGIGIPPPPV